MTMTVQEFIEQVKAREAKATKGPLRVGIFDPEKDPVELFREHLSHGDGPIWAVFCPNHPEAKGTPEKPEFAVLLGITGNGPTSQANADKLAANDGPALLAMVEAAMDDSNFVVNAKYREAHWPDCLYAVRKAMQAAMERANGPMA